VAGSGVRSGGLSAGGAVGGVEVAVDGVVVAQLPFAAADTMTVRVAVAVRLEWPVTR
jgi:hypothetical protein